jgi:hypothetical protein
MNNAFGDTTSEATFTSLFNRALAKGSENGTFDRPKGMFPIRSIQHAMFCVVWHRRSPLLRVVPCIPSCPCFEHPSSLLHVANIAMHRSLWPGEAREVRR